MLFCKGSGSQSTYHMICILLRYYCSYISSVKSDRVMLLYTECGNINIDSQIAHLNKLNIFGKKMMPLVNININVCLKKSKTTNIPNSFGN